MVNTLLGEFEDIEDVCKGCVMSVRGKIIRIYLIPLEIYDFEIILEIDWLCAYG